MFYTKETPNPLHIISINILSNKNTSRLDPALYCWGGPPKYINSVDLKIKWAPGSGGPPRTWKNFNKTIKTIIITHYGAERYYKVGAMYEKSGKRDSINI